MKNTNRRYTSNLLMLIVLQLTVCETLSGQTRDGSASIDAVIDFELTEVQIERAVRPLPPSLREGATVVAFDSNWDPYVVRQGTGDINCVGTAPFMGSQFAVCQHKRS